MQLQRGDRQNIIGRDKQSDQESLECKETLAELTSSNCENRVKPCGCKCRCQPEEVKQDPLEKKKLKRKSAKKRQKQKQRQKSTTDTPVDHQRAKREVRQCLQIESSKEKVCDFINVVIRDQVEAIRKQISSAIIKYQNVEQGREDEAVKAIFGPIEQIARASHEVEELINLFVNQFIDDDNIPLQKNFGRSTLKFIVKADLYKSDIFNTICSYIFREPAQRYRNQRELISYMMNIIDPEDSGSVSSSYSEGTEDYMDDEDDWEEEGSTIESQKESIQKDNFKESPKGKKKYRRKKIKEQMETNYEAILKRTEELDIQKYERDECHVTQQCLARLRKRKWKYMLKEEKK